MGGQVTGHPFYLMGGLNRRGQMHKVLIILVIHSYDEIEVKEVQAGNRAGTMGKSITTIKSGIAHPAVRKFSPMASISSGRINLESVRGSVFLYYMFKDSMCCRRPADVSQAHEKDFVFIVEFCHFLSVYNQTFDSTRN
jgi:hypothetical protein